MTLSGLLFTTLVVAVIVAAGVVLAAVLRHTPRARAADLLARGDFEKAVATARESAASEELVPASIAARHLGDLATAKHLAERAVRADRRDGEAWLELGLVLGYAGELDAADETLARAAALRSDLAEAVTLHRAWVALRGGDVETARRLFDEGEAPLETKLQLDLGSGDPVFADWFFHAGEIWTGMGRSEEDEEKGRWAIGEARRSAPGSRLFEGGEVG